MKNRFMKNILISATFIVGALSLAACQTIPYEQRVANYESDIKGKYVGKSLDDLILAYGPPQSSYDLSDGRKVVQYTNEKQGVVGGQTWVNYDTVYAGSRVINRPNGTRVAVPVYATVPYWETEPTYTYHQKCVQRFIVDKTNIVQDFKWEGNSCFK